MTLTPSERSLRAKLAAHALHAQYDSRDLTAKARKSFQDSFYEKTDVSLPHEKRLRRAEHLRKAFYTRLALKSAQARRPSA